MATSEEQQIDPVQDTSGTGTSQEGAQASGDATSQKLMNAVVIGGTGAIGRCLVGILLRDETKFGKVTVIGRRKLDHVDEQYHVNVQEEEASGRLIQIEQDMDNVDDETIQRQCTGAHVFFCTLGTTRKTAGSAQRFYEIDHDIPLKFGKAAKAVGVSHYSLVTSSGAKASSMLLYFRTKGEIEDDILNLKFNYTTILRPGLLDRGPDKKFAEKLASIFFKAMPVSSVAEAMAIDAYSRFIQGYETEGGDVSISTTLIMDNRGIYETVGNEILKNRSANIGSSVDPPAKELKDESSTADENQPLEEQNKGTEDVQETEETTEKQTVEETNQQPKPEETKETGEEPPKESTPAEGTSVEPPKESTPAEENSSEKTPVEKTEVEGKSEDEKADEQ